MWPPERGWARRIDVPRIAAAASAVACAEDNPSRVVGNAKQQELHTYNFCRHENAAPVGNCAQALRKGVQPTVSEVNCATAPGISRSVAERTLRESRPYNRSGLSSIRPLVEGLLLSRGFRCSFANPTSPDRQAVELAAFAALRGRINGVQKDRSSSGLPDPNRWPGSGSVSGARQAWHGHNCRPGAAKGRISAAKDGARPNTKVAGRQEPRRRPTVGPFGPTPIPGGRLMFHGISQGGRWEAFAAVVQPTQRVTGGVVTKSCTRTTTMAAADPSPTIGPGGQSLG